MRKTVFNIAFEGIDNSGKTTLSTMLSEELTKKGHNVYLSKELTTPVGQFIMDSFTGQTPALSPQMKTLLFSADRLVRMEDSAMNGKDIIIWDRYIYSALAYRSMEGLNNGWVADVNSIFPKPDMTFLLDVSIEESFKRGKMAKKSCPYTPKELSKCRDIYHQFSERGQLIHIDDKSIKDMKHDVLQRVLNEYN